MHLLSTMVTLATIIALTTASPTPHPANAVQPHSKRSGPGVHLANCRAPALTFSAIIYYPDDSAAVRNVYPGDQNAASVNTPLYTDFVHWEGEAVEATFSTGVTFISGINSDAASKSTGTRVGTGYNGSQWNCFKDNGHQLFSIERGTCYSLYYCIPA